jgi:hypothetical protein
VDSTCQEITRLEWNSKVDLSDHDSAPTVPILSEMNPTHTIRSYFSKIDLNIILSMPRSSEWSLTLRLRDQNFVHISHLHGASLKIQIRCRDVLTIGKMNSPFDFLDLKMYL